MALLGSNQIRTDGRGSVGALPAFSRPAGIVSSGRKKSIPEIEKNSARNYELDCPVCAKRSPACHCSKADKAKIQEPCQPHHNILSRVGINGEIELEEYKNGVRFLFPSKGDTTPPQDCDRASTEQSAKSRRNCAFVLGNAETSWKAMILLSYPKNPTSYTEVADHRTRFIKSLRAEWGVFDYAWFLEFTRRGVAHYHVFIGDGGALGSAIAASKGETVMRHGSETRLIRGDVDDSVVHHWRRITSDGSQAWENFQTGGIVEKLRSADAAGRYAAKEAGKRIQKKAPWPVNSWWYISNSVRPVSRGKRIVTVRDYLQYQPDGKMISTRYGKEILSIAGFGKKT